MADQPNSLFEANTPTQANEPAVGSNPAAAPNINNDYADLLSSIKNERGEQKYKNLAEALVGLAHAQNYIPELKVLQAQKDAEIERLRVEAQRVATLEESLAALTSQQQANTPQGNTVLDENKLADLVNQTLTKREQAVIAQSNQQMVVSTLQQSFGADAEKKFNETAAAMGLSIAEMNALAAKSPKLILTALGVTATQSAQRQAPVTTPGSVNTSAFTPQETTFVKRNPNPALIGATTQQIKQSFETAKAMVEELHAKGQSVHDLTDPKVYFKYFN